MVLWFGFAQKVACDGMRPANTGNAGALARIAYQARNPQSLSRHTVSRFALNAGEGARVPSINQLVSWSTDFLGKA